MKIRKITLKDGGIKGADVEYLQENARKIMEPHTWDAKNMVPLSIEKAFKDLREHALGACGYPMGMLDDNLKQMYINRMIVKAVEFSEDHVCISGVFRATDDKDINLKTYKIQEFDEYDGYEALRELIDSLKEETIAYLNGSKKVDDKEVIIRWAQAKGVEGDFTMDKLGNINPEQLAQYCKTILEKGVGALVVLPEDLSDTDEEMLRGVIEDVKVEVDSYNASMLGPVSEADLIAEDTSEVDDSELSGGFESESF